MKDKIIAAAAATMMVAGSAFAQATVETETTVWTDNSRAAFFDAEGNMLTEDEIRTNWGTLTTEEHESIRETCTRVAQSADDPQGMEETLGGLVDANVDIQQWNQLCQTVESM